MFRGSSLGGLETQSQAGGQPYPEGGACPPVVSVLKARIWAPFSCRTPRTQSWAWRFHRGGGGGDWHSSPAEEPTDTSPRSSSGPLENSAMSAALTAEQTPSPLLAAAFRSPLGIWGSFLPFGPCGPGRDDITPWLWDLRPLAAADGSVRQANGGQWTATGGTVEKGNSLSAA